MAKAGWYVKIEQQSNFLVLSEHRPSNILNQQAFFSLKESCDRVIETLGNADPKLITADFSRSNASEGFKQAVILVQANNQLAHRKIAQNIILAAQVKIVNLTRKFMVVMIAIAINGADTFAHIRFNSVIWLTMSMVGLRFFADITPSRGPKNSVIWV